MTQSLQGLLSWTFLFSGLVACSGEPAEMGAAGASSSMGGHVAGEGASGASGNSSAEAGRSGTGGASGGSAGDGTSSAAGPGGGAAGSGGGAGNGGNNSGGANAGGTSAGGTSAGGTSAGGTSAGGAAGLETIHFFGRWNRVLGKAIAVNGGSYIQARFSGTGVTARFDVTLNQAPAPTLAFRIDQGDWQEGELTASVVLATGLPPGSHDVWLVVRGLNEQQSRWTPPLISSITFSNFDVVGGALEPSARPVRPKLEFLGDSITEGVAVWPNRAGKATACWRADGRLGYASQTAQLLGAEWRQVGFGGQGVLQGGNGGVPVFNDSFAFIYAGVPRDDWQPDMAVVNAGTVDRANTSTTFGPTYQTYLATVRAGYPAAKIAALRPFGGYHASEIKAAVLARNAAGDSKVFYVDTSGWLVAADYTDGIHPTASGSAKAAQALAPALQKLGLP